ncbi:MAG TPA: ABC transporter permease [Actinomycetota bacterium]|nr:ABC transporter permease [Actinomycetota bacterium]
MSATSTVTRPAPTAGRLRAEVARTFFSILGRDLFVTGRELPTFLAQVILQPLFMVFVFGKVLTELGFARAGFAELLLPGIIALTVAVTGLQGTALPLVIDFSFTKEIEDRLLAPLPVSFVALEKILFGTLRALIAGAIMFPIGRLVLGTLPFQADRTWLLIVFLLLGAVMGSGLGMTLGTLVQPNQISIVFALVLTPLLFTGCTQYPWPSLSSLRWFQVLTLVNPLTYMSEGVRASMVPQVPHMHAWIAMVILVFATVALVVAGVAGFMRRALD